MTTNLTHKIAYNTLVSTGARILGIALALINIGFITRYLGPSVFGDYTLVLVFVYLFSVLADLGLESIVVRELVKDGHREEKVLGTSFI